eukprot:CAMPEP_0114548008 /NCGR_PEP_ID=MMETSP0114-20121206/4754_1 /TAXON_ID=31324 /ORGANISM="Goniomonas sp, Strain m" /LENGTH=186 /DNA_ID=CAMNT_0001732573 /DNA_START=60 /DNA_END=617 /DNA_ORIENTATION=+
MAFDGGDSFAFDPSRTDQDFFELSNENKTIRVKEGGEFVWAPVTVPFIEGVHSWEVRCDKLPLSSDGELVLGNETFSLSGVKPKKEAIAAGIIVFTNKQMDGKFIGLPQWNNCARRNLNIDFHSGQGIQGPADIVTDGRIRMKFDCEAGVLSVSPQPDERFIDVVHGVPTPVWFMVGLYYRDAQVT